jgi:SAM-dependent methyltransferase
MENPTCFCGGSRYTQTFAGVWTRYLEPRQTPFSVKACDACGLARTFPVPDDGQYAHGYDPTTQDGKFIGSTTDAWSRRIAQYVRARCDGTTLLDVGCHVGNLVAVAEEYGFDARGIDIDPVAVEAGRRLGRNIELRTIAAIEGAYDAVVLNHVLEHVGALRPFLANLARLLVPGGRAFILVPYHRGLVPRLMADHWFGWVPSQHVWQFTPATLQAVVKDAAGLQPVEVTTTGAIEPPSAGVKGQLKAFVQAASRRLNAGDQIEAVFERPLS